MRPMQKLFTALYAIVPLIAIPYWAYVNQNWFLLFGIPVSYLGSFSGAKNSKVVIYLNVFCVGFWFKQGFSFHQYVTFFFFCALWGYLIYLIAAEYKDFGFREFVEKNPQVIKKILENEQLIDLHIQQFMKDNPGAKMTDEIRGRIILEIIGTQPLTQ